MSDWTVLALEEDALGTRLDTALARSVGTSRSQAAKMIDQGLVRVDGQHVDRSHKIGPNSVVELGVEPAVEPAPVEQLPVLYEDAHLIIINKPAFVAAHSGPGWTGPTVTGSLEAAGVRVSTSGPPERKGIVQRLDVGTTGAMVIAKSELAYSRLKNAFRDRTVEKTYHTLVEGYPDPDRGTVDAPIGRHPGYSWKMAVLEGGRQARTHYDTIEVLPGASLLEVDLETGRTHQIRVHMSALGHPCVGDTFYGADPTRAHRLDLERQWLHARKLRFTHPVTEEIVEVTAPYPQDLEMALRQLRNP